MQCESLLRALARVAVGMREGPLQGLDPAGPELRERVGRVRADPPRLIREPLLEGGYSAVLRVAAEGLRCLGSDLPGGVVERSDQDRDRGHAAARAERSG